MRRPAIPTFKLLDRNAISVNPVYIPDVYDLWLASRCQSCGEIVPANHTTSTRHGFHDLSRCNGQLTPSWPASCLVFPLPCFCMNLDEACLRIAHLPIAILEHSNAIETYSLAVIEKDDNYGGELDLAEAYLLLGYLPPASLVALPPRMSKREDAVLAGMMESCRLMIAGLSERYQLLKEHRRENKA